MGPGPGLLRHERQEWGEQPQLHIERDGQGGLRRGLTLAVLGTVGALLHKFQVVVAEGPEERLHGLQRLGVVEGLEGCGACGDDI